MTYSISAPPDVGAAASAGRKFGFTVGAAFAVFALVARWRQHPTVFLVLGTLGLVLIVAALVIPGRLGPVEHAWMALAHLISRVTTPLFMGAVYFIVLTPTGIIRRRLGGNALVHRPGPHGYWSNHNAAESSLDRQF